MSVDFEKLVSQHSGRIKRIAMRYADPGETEDLALQGGFEYCFIGCSEKLEKMEVQLQKN